MSHIFRSELTLSMVVCIDIEVRSLVLYSPCRVSGKYMANLPYVSSLSLQGEGKVQEKYGDGDGTGSRVFFLLHVAMSSWDDC